MQVSFDLHQLIKLILFTLMTSFVSCKLQLVTNCYFSIFISENLFSKSGAFNSGNIKF